MVGACLGEDLDQVTSQVGNQRFGLASWKPNLWSHCAKPVLNKQLGKRFKYCGCLCNCLVGVLIDQRE